MKPRLVSYSVLTVVLMGGLSLVLLFRSALQNRAQEAKASADTTTTPRTSDGRPDLTGFWYDDLNDPVGDLTILADGSKVFNFEYADKPRDIFETGRTSSELGIPYTPEYLKRVKASAARTVETLNPDDPSLQCKPMGITRLNREGHHNGFQIVQHPDYIAILYEEAPGPAFRVVYTDGRPHPKNFINSYMGHSIGHWEGNTLVVDVIGLNDETLLDEVAPGGELFYHSDEEHVIERWSRNGNVLTYQATVEDPIAFTKPWVITPRQIHLARKDAIKDYIEPHTCATAPIYSANPDIQQR